MPTIEDYRKYIIANRTALKLNAIASAIQMDVGDFSRAINGKKRHDGKTQNMPDRCLPLLEQYFKSINIKI